MATEAIGRATTTRHRTGRVIPNGNERMGVVETIDLNLVAGYTTELLVACTILEFYL